MQRGTLHYELKLSSIFAKKIIEFIESSVEYKND